MEIAKIGNWQSEEIKEIRVTQQVGEISYPLVVRRFIPEPGDALERTWKTENETMLYRCTPFTVVNMERTGQELNVFIKQAVGPFISHFTSNTDGLLRTTYTTAYRCAQSVSSSCLSAFSN